MVADGFTGGSQGAGFNPVSSERLVTRLAGNHLGKSSGKKRELTSFGSWPKQGPQNYSWSLTDMLLWRDLL